MIYKEKINKKRGGGGGSKEGVAANVWDKRGKEAVTWAMVGRVKSGFTDTWLVDKSKGENYVVISRWLVTSLVVSKCHGSNEPCIQTNC